MKKLINILCVIFATVLIASCGSKSELAGHEAKLLGKWNSPIFSFEFSKGGKMKIIESKRQLQLDYFLTNENNSLYLHIISMGDTNKMYIDSLSDTYLRMAPVKNLKDIKEFTKAK